MNYWLFVIPREDLWVKCRSRSVCAAGFRGRKRGDKSSAGWRRFIERAAEIRPGDFVITYLKKNRIGSIGKVVERYDVDRWDSLIETKKGADYGRLLKVLWEKDSLTPDGKVALIPEELRRSGEQLATMNKIKPERLDQFRQILRDPKNWIDLSKNHDTHEGDDESEEEGKAILEEHLRDLIASTPEKLEKGLRLNSDEAASVEVTTDIGIIDILCIDRKGNLVVVELKRGGASDRVVGQSLRYMGWLNKHRDQFPEAKGEKVRGMIVAFQPDEKLQYATSVVPDIEVKSYRMRIEID